MSRLRDSLSRLSKLKSRCLRGPSDGHNLDYLDSLPPRERERERKGGRAAGGRSIPQRLGEVETVERVETRPAGRASSRSWLRSLNPRWVDWRSRQVYPDMAVPASTTTGWRARRAVEGGDKYAEERWVLAAAPTEGRSRPRPPRRVKVGTRSEYACPATWSVRLTVRGRSTTPY